MRAGAFLFSGEWKEAVSRLGETGIGYTVVSVVLKDGTRFDQVLIELGYLSRIRGRADIPFTEDDIAEIKRTDEKRHWIEKP